MSTLKEIAQQLRPVDLSDIPCIWSVGKSKYEFEIHRKSRGFHVVINPFSNPGAETIERVWSNIRRMTQVN